MSNTLHMLVKNLLLENGKLPGRCFMYKAQGMFCVFSREDFLRIPELAINPLGDRIVHAFFMEG